MASNLHASLLLALVCLPSTLIVVVNGNFLEIIEHSNLTSEYRNVATKHKMDWRVRFFPQPLLKYRILEYHLFRPGYMQAGPLAQPSHYLVSVMRMHQIASGVEKAMQWSPNGKYIAGFVSAGNTPISANINSNFNANQGLFDSRVVKTINMAQPGLKWMVRRSNDGPSGMHSSLINLYSEVLPKIWANNKEFIKGRVRYGSYHVTATVGDTNEVVTGLTFRLHVENNYNYAEILLMGVRPARQGEGLGRKAFERLVWYLKSYFPFNANTTPRSGVNTVCVWASETAVDFYKRLNFTVINPKTRQYAAAQHYTMSKLLEYFIYE